eukprot:1881110-Amphidinium_carterae.1
MNRRCLLIEDVGIRHLRKLANRLGWVPQPSGWLCGDQYSTSLGTTLTIGLSGTQPVRFVLK